jgi:hypothetical protein
MRKASYYADMANRNADRIEELEEASLFKSERIALLVKENTELRSRIEAGLNAWINGWIEELNDYMPSRAKDELESLLEQEARDDETVA